MRCQDIWEGCGAAIIVRDAMGFTDAETRAARVEIWEADPEDVGAPWIEYRAFDAVWRRRVVWRQR